ncbi:hypothetical protein Nepgr_022255 [Nepenthes gracilis]|uniref:non-specific serine/threonine protein kinase n=1 Tax=Nepenthes gracilis TaxID=150966 RepID=A0AAD3XXW1_NEPGR|nr:hypothetical protein Nepgr_022255 [Nepenthes gracilis]
MNCFPCFSSHGKKSSKWINSARGRPPSPAPPKRARQPRPENSKPRDLADSADGMEANIAGSNNIAAQTFTFRELATATKNFRHECLLGEGGFGRVYRGQFAKTGQIVAIKQLDRNGLQGNKEFLVEVLMLSLLHHPNLVNLIGYCADGDQRLLVYEFMPSGSLEDHLFDLSRQQKPLDWYTRMRIALAASKGLEYLHDEANPPVIYCDLKSSNILLDDEFNAKLSDFGLAKLGPIGDRAQVSSRVMGTYGYCAPEYQRTGHLTVKSDVYSFGVVLLELITGRRAIDTARPIEEQNLVSWANPVFKAPKRFPELVDPRLGRDFPVKGLNQAVAIAAMCLQEEETARPFMSDVVTALSFLSTAPEGCIASHVPSEPSSPHIDRSMCVNGCQADEDSICRRQQAVAEAIEWGFTTRRNDRSRDASSSSL